jgi:hypothetical protein
MTALCISFARMISARSLLPQVQFAIDEQE